MYDSTRLIPVGLRAADVETPRSILVVVAWCPQHPSHLTTVLCSELVRQVSKIPHGDLDTADELGAVGFFSVHLLLAFKTLLPTKLCYGGHK